MHHNGAFFYCRENSVSESQFGVRLVMKGLQSTRKIKYNLELSKYNSTLLSLMVVNKQCPVLDFRYSETLLCYILVSQVRSLSSPSTTCKVQQNVYFNITQSINNGAVLQVSMLSPQLLNHRFYFCHRELKRLFNLAEKWWHHLHHRRTAALPGRSGLFKYYVYIFS